MKVRIASVVRGVGAGAACLAPGVRSQATAVLGSYGTAWGIDPHGIQLVSISSPEHELPLVRAGLPFVTSAASWAVVQLLAVRTLRRSGIPDPIAAIAWGALVAVADSLVAETFLAAQKQAADTEGAAGDAEAADPAEG